MVSHINTILKQSLQTFMGKHQPIETFIKNFQVLKGMVDTLTAEHVNLDPKFNKADTWNLPKKAPMTYIEVYKDQFINIAIFILKPGMTLPLHDHPQMHGLLKVISGSVKIQSYSLRPDLMDSTAERVRSDGEHVETQEEIIAEKNDDVILDATSECCVLEPVKGNFHEIQSIDGASAFLDVLAPPYDVDIPVYGPRKCTFYQELREVAPNIYELEKLPEPDWFWGDVAPYTGPELILEQAVNE